MATLVFVRKRIELGDGEGSGPDTFDFLGFTHHMGRSRKGKRILRRKTSSKALRASLKRLNQ